MEGSGQVVSAVVGLDAGRVGGKVGGRARVGGCKISDSLRTESHKPINNNKIKNSGCVMMMM